MSSSLQMRSTVYDSDSDSDFDNPLSEETKEPEYGEDCPWRSVVDPASGKTYYYHAETRETQWNKPSEMASREEKEALAAKERKQKDFFAAMEANIMQSIAQGFKAPEKKNRLDVEFENKPISDDPLSVSSRSTSSRRQLSPQRSRLTRVSSSSSQRSHRSLARPNLIRTISSMDSAYLSDLICRVPSSRHVTGRPIGNSSTSSRSIGLGLGSSHHSNRSGARMPRGIPKRSLVAPAKSKAEDNKQADNKDDDDDDGPPPLTVVTTPDLRTGLSKRESLGVDALMAGEDIAKPNLERGTSLTLAELSGPSFHGNLGTNLGGSSNLMGSSWMDQSASSRLNTSDHSLRLNPHASEHSLGAGFMGGSFNKSSTPDLLNNCSFNSFESSDASFSGLNSSQNGGLSVASSLHPVRESMNESPSNPRLSVDNVVLEGDNEDDDTPEEASFSLGGDGDFNDDQITSNWLDALPQDSAANNEDMVGYGNDAKRFSDAGFTSFFDESMANFDLSDKETKALQKLAFISEEMTKVAEGEEDSSEDTEEDDSSDELSLGGDEGQQEFPLFFGSEEEAAVTEEEDPSSEDSNHSPVTPSFPPAFKTPTVSRKSKTTETTEKPEPSRRAPAKRTLGPKNTRVSRAQRNLLISAADDSSDDEEAAAPAPAPASNLPVRNLALAAATLTIDNARSHSINHFNEPSSSNPAGAAAAQSFRQGRMARRHTGDASISTLRSSQTDGRPTLEKQSGSQGNLQVHNAARRLSMFKLKNIDRSKLRSTHGGKGGLAQALATEDTKPDIKRSGTTGASVKAQEDTSNRPNLVRRNTCGTLYVGTTMSAPDKDATIKCVCGVFRAHILQCERDQDVDISPKFRIFNDLESQQGTSRRINTSSRRAPSASSVPSLEQITTFYRDVFQRAQMEYDCIIISLIYVERLVKTTKGALRPRAENWRSILFSCMVLASKVWDDLSMWNADFSATCPTGVKFPLKRINELELAILSALSYRVKVPASEYAKYYFLLRSMLIKSGLVGDNVDTTTPLDVEGARRLQQVSKEFQSGMGETRRKIRKAKSMRSKSMGEDERVRVMTGARRASQKNKKVSLEHVVTM